ncbi:Uncharacterized protein Fot_06136 [Forsythia ovata]|uniref:t-SNARE coiled-coil homology domain-containing protein n=1 Tax=Forsythia ovata TaxID=205694 RepID=A0ABD1WS38_9LAMI
MLGDLRYVTSQVRDWQQTDARTRSNQRTLDYQYHAMHDQVSRIGSRMETLDENVARISETNQEAMLGDLRYVTSQVRDWQQTDARTRSNQRTLDYQYHAMHDQVSRIESRMETLDENVARISETHFAE